MAAMQSLYIYPLDLLFGFILGITSGIKPT